MEEFEEICPECGSLMYDHDCEVCGFSNFPEGRDEYETPQGTIAHCTEEEALDAGYIMLCPTCAEQVITWWENEDHGCCITCWHSKNKGTLTKE